MPRAPPLRLLLAPLALLLAAGCAEPAPAPAPFEGEPDDATSHEVTLEPSSFYTAQLDLARPAHVRGTVEVLEGGPIDAWLAAGAECQAFQQGAFSPLAQSLATRNATLEAQVPRGLVCMPFDNDAMEMGEAAPEGPVRVRFSLSVWYE